LNAVTLLLSVAVPVVRSRIGDPPLEKYGLGDEVWVQVFSYTIATPVALTEVLKVKVNVGVSRASALLIACQ